MLHGCAIWYDLTGQEIAELERTQCRVFRIIQGLPPRTHNAISRRLLGELAMLSRIKLSKLGFLHRLISSKSSSLVKKVFVRRMYENMINDKMKGFVPDIVSILHECTMMDNLRSYMYGGQFPSKYQWKLMSRHGVQKLDTANSKNNLISKRDNQRCVRILFSTDNIQMHPFHWLIKSSKEKKYVKPCMTAIRLLALPETSYSSSECVLCQKEYIMTSCVILLPNVPACTGNATFSGNI